jgi:hypothetical protein
MLGEVVPLWKKARRPLKDTGYSANVSLWGAGKEPRGQENISPHKREKR